MKIAIALCTRKRPKMLSRCLSSIQTLKLPQNCDLHVVVIENGDRPSCELDVKSQMSATPEIGFTYQLEKKLGISSARNSSVEIALKSNPDWIAFIDDDEVVPEDWLFKYVEAMNTVFADVYTGPVDRILLDEAPIWYKKPAKLNYENLSKMEEASTNNALVNSDYFNGKKEKLRFDEAYNFSGGEDSKLFFELIHSGGTIRFVKNAIVIEYRTAERASKKWLIKGSYYAGNLNSRMSADLNGRWNAISTYSYKIFSNLHSGISFTIWGILIYPFSKRAIRYIVKGLIKLSWLIGFTTGLFNISHQQYKHNIEGN